MALSFHMFALCLASGESGDHIIILCKFSRFI